METRTSLDSTAAFAAQASEAARLLDALSNESRLLVLCHLATGETTVGELARRVGLSQSALSQHLAKLRHQGLVATRRQSQLVFYRLADSRARRVIALLHELFCPELGAHPETLQGVDHVRSGS